jgi:hypothetical protein
MKTVFLLLLLSFSVAQAQETTSDDFQKLPATIEMDGNLFCSRFGSQFAKTCHENLNQNSTLEMNLTPQNSPAQRKWVLRLYFGNANTFYNPTNMTIKTSRLDITMQNVEAKQRTGYDYFKIWERPFKDCLRWIDEPTNNLKIVMDKNNHQFFLSINHPKLVYINGHTNPGLNNNGNVHVTGTVDGIYHDGTMPVNPVFDGYNTQPGELNITKFENSWMFMQYELGYGYAIPLHSFKKAGSIVFTPQIQAGIYTGYKNAAIMKKGGYWDHDYHYDTKTHIMGFSITPAARLEWRSPKERIGVFTEYRRSFGSMNYPFMDGTIEHKNNYHSITLGFSTSIRKLPFKRK